MKKKILPVLAGIVALFGLAACSGGGQPENIRISFDSGKSLTQDLVLVYDMEIHPVEMDGLGKGVYEIKGKNFLYFKMFLGQQPVSLYLEAGDDVTVSFNPDNYTESVQVSGGRQAAYDYLNTFTYTSLPDEDYALSLDDYKKKLAEKEASAVKILSNTIDKKSGNFLSNERERIRYSYASSRLMYSVGHRFMTQLPDYKPDEAYYDYVAELFVENEDIIDLEVYRNYMIEAAAMLASKGEKRDLYHKTLDQMEFLSDNMKSPKVRESLMYHTMIPYIEQVGTDNLGELPNLFHAFVKDTAKIASYKAACDKWDFSAPGRISPDFKATDADGKTHRLAEFRGKYVYIDLWATWCNPCRRELPHLAELEKKLSDKNIFFVSLSIDGNKEDWESFLKSNKMTGVQLHIGNENSFLKAYRVDGIPRFILLDKDGRIISNNMTRPSSPETEKMLAALPGM